MGNVLHAQEKEWEAIEKSATPTLVDFWADWCAPCRMLAPVFERLAENYANEVNFAKVNVDELPELASELGIRSIPTLLLIRDGKVLERLVGVRSHQELADVLDRHLVAPEKK
jgi:thioredoxin 1